MNVFKYLKILYFGKEALINQVSIFSLVGIMVISLSEYLTYLLGNLSSSFLGYAPASHFVLAGYLFVGLMLLIYFIGYSFDVAKFSQIGNFSQISLASYKTFVKMFPISIAWFLYLLFAVRQVPYRLSAYMSIFRLLLFDFNVHIYENRKGNHNRNQCHKL